MCGIIGAIAKNNVVPVLLQGLQRLEYRGYDSAGLATIDNNKLQRIRSIGRVADLARQSSTACGYIGIAHTRWATHGAPITSNSSSRKTG